MIISTYLLNITIKRNKLQNSLSSYDYLISERFHLNHVTAEELNDKSKDWKNSSCIGNEFKLKLLKVQ